MTKELLNQMKDFEIFAEKMEEFVISIKKENDGQYDFRDFDLRTYDGNSYKFPEILADYFNLWEVVEEAYKMSQIDDIDKNLWPDEMFFDLYWNDKKSNPKSAYYHDRVFWIRFDKEKGVIYMPEREE